MTTTWALSIALNVLCCALLFPKRNIRLIWWNQAASAVLSVVFVVLYYSPICSQQEYETATLLADVFCSWFELIIAARYASDSCTTAQTYLMLAICAHQLVKLEWHWMAAPFQEAIGPFAYLNPLRAVLNVVVMALYVVVAYSYDDATASEEKYAQA